MKPLIALLLLQFFLTPWQLLNNMQKRSVHPSDTVSVQGINLDSGKTVKLSYDALSDTLLFDEGGAVQKLSGDSVELWMRLFFLKRDKGAEQTDALAGYLKKAGVDMAKKVLSTTGKGGDVIYVIGVEKRDQTAPQLALYQRDYLPWKLTAGGREVIFTEYHKSVLPITFPGLIEIKNITNNTTVRYRFFRNEYIQ